MADSARAYDYVLWGADWASREEFDSSTICFEAAALIYERLKKIDLVLYCGNRVADNHLRQGDCRNAALALTRLDSLEQASGKETSPEAVQTLYLKGYLAMALDSADAAISCLNTSVMLATRMHGDGTLIVGNCHYMLALAYQKAGQIDSALVYTERSLMVYRGLGEQHPLEMAVALSLLGNLMRTKGDVDRSCDILKEALSLLGGNGIDRNMTVCSLHTMLGSTYSERGELQKAIAHFDTAVNLARQLRGNDDIFTASIYASLGEAYSEANEWSRAAKCINVAIERTVRHYGPRNSNLARLYDILARDYYFHDSLETGKAAIDKAIALESQLLGKRQSSLARMYETRGLIEQRQGRFREALASFGLARETFLILGNEGGSQVVSLLVSMSSSFLSLGLIDSAEYVLRHALMMRTEGFSPDSRQLSSIWRELGRVYERAGQREKGLQAYDEAMARAKIRYTSGGVEGGVLHVQEYVASALEKIRLLQEDAGHTNPGLSSLQESVRLCREAIRAIERSRQALREQESKIAFSERSNPFSQRGIEASLRLWRLTGNPTYKDTAFAFAEFGRSRVLVEALDRETSLKVSGVPESVIARALELSRAIGSAEVLLHRMRESPSPTRPQEATYLETKQLALLQELSRLQDSVRSAFPQIQEWMAASQDVDVSAMRASLPENGALIEYVRGSGGIYAFVVRAHDISIIDLGNGRGLEKLVSDYLTSIRTVRPQSYLSSAYALHRMLILPLKRHLTGIEHLIIAPEWSFASIPFEALLERKIPHGDDVGGVDFSRLPYLIKRFSISYAYSASSLIRTQNRLVEQTQNDDLLAFAPVFSDREHSLRKGKEGHHIKGPNLASRGSDHLDELKSLPHSVSELESIGSLFSEIGRGSKVFLGSKASEFNFKSACARPGYLHLATHGLINPEAPSRSALAFSYAADDDSTEDGLLYAEEIYRLTLNAKLVVLSSCESGVGKVFKGEGLLALTRGFFYAGAEKVVCSLWKVLDSSTKVFMVRFYRDSLHGQNVVRSMRRAKLDLIASPSTSYPRDWAGFVLFGM